MTEHRDCVSSPVRGQVWIAPLSGPKRGHWGQQSRQRRFLCQGRSGVSDQASQHARRRKLAAADSSFSPDWNASGAPTSRIPSPKPPTGSASLISPRNCHSCPKRTRTGLWAAQFRQDCAGARAILQIYPLRAQFTFESTKGEAKVHRLCRPSFFVRCSSSAFGT